MSTFRTIRSALALHLCSARMTGAPRSLHDAIKNRPEAANELFEAVLPKLLAFIRVQASDKLLARESVRDIAQSVFREVLQDAASLEYRGDEALRKLLFIHAVRKILDRDRRRTSARRNGGREIRLADRDGDRLTESVLSCYGDFATPVRVASAREQLARFEAAMRTLPEDQREAVAMNRLLQLSYAEVARALEKTESAVRGLVARGLARITSLLRDSDI